MFFTCGPNEAMVVSGFCRSPPVMVAGGRVFVLPCIQQIQRISLNTLTLNVKSEKVYTRHGVPISVTGIAQVKIQGQNKEMLAAACQMFLGKTEAEIAHIALETLEGHQRAIMAHMTVESAPPTQVAKTKQQIEEQRVQVQVVERAQQVAVQEQEIARREKELEARVRKPAEAERYKLERLAEAEKSQLIMQAEAEAESVRMRGEAEAFAIGARARAEAEQMAKKAEAFQLYQEAAQLDMLLEKLPQVAEEISGPLTSANKITLVSSGSGTMGAAKVTGEVLDILTRLPESVERLTGVSISQVNHKPLRTA
ncbi:PREDICTED: flotillin-1 [Colobus angolensis palliatus]|uniref:flotillin-1 n=1 Tax=Colobus angolensis palliatus TaxID=336983 RepID=UPI0005F3A460|nr:PREDICTED: flotillin-1 [Colobus angolensis palliatus]